MQTSEGGEASDSAFPIGRRFSAFFEKVGDPVVLSGKGLPVEEIASAARTIAYELLCCGVPARVAIREIHGSGEEKARVGT